MAAAIPIRYGGQTFPSRQALARHLATITGRSWKTCQTWLQRFDSGVERVIAHAAAAKPSRREITVAGRAFSSQAAFARYLHQHYGVGIPAVSGWLSTEHLTPEQCLERASGYRKKHRKAREFEGEMVLYGWRFTSANALCTYYKINPTKFLAEWRARSPGARADMIPACLRAIAVLWEAMRLDERNRHPPEVEARLPKSCLPTNTTIDETALTAYERRTLDCLQPDDVRTPRRDGLAWHARMRQRIAS